MAARPPHAGGGPPSAAARPPGIPPHPQTLDGAAVLHQMFRLDRSAWRTLDGGERNEIVSEASSALHDMEDNDTGGSALFSLLGHKGDLLVLHFRPDLEQVHRAELDVAKLRLAEFLEPTTSYVSVVELGLYDSSFKLYQELAEPRLAQYMNFHPVPDPMDEERRQERITLWQERRALGRGPYPGDPRRWEAKNYGPAKLTPLGRKLLGIDLWD